MNRKLSVLTVLGFLNLFVPSDTVAAEGRCVGRIIIVGNEYTPDWFIFELIYLRSGDVLRYPEMRIAERDLARCGRFVVDPEKNIRPTVMTLKENDMGSVVDIVITVHERPRSRWIPASIDAVAIRTYGIGHYCYGLAREIFFDLPRTTRILSGYILGGAKPCD